MKKCEGCQHWHNGLGDFTCLKCKEIDNEISKEYHETREFQCLGDMITAARENDKLVSLVDCLKKVDTRDALIFLQHKLSGDSINSIALQYDISRQTVWRSIKSVKSDVALFSGLSSSTSL